MLQRYETAIIVALTVLIVGVPPAIFMAYLVGKYDGKAELRRREYEAAMNAPDELEPPEPPTWQGDFVPRAKTDAWLTIDLEDRMS